MEAMLRKQGLHHMNIGYFDHRLTPKKIPFFRYNNRRTVIFQSFIGPA
jgi:hypothetical protein